MVYPSFQHYHAPNLKTWHSQYTKRITVIVFPLMLGQLVLGIVMVASLDLLAIIRLILVIATWLTTLVIFVPLHNKIDATDEVQKAVKALIKKNWIRTGLWSLLLVLSWVEHFIF